MPREDVVRVDPDGTVEEILPMEKYFCTKCGRNHRETSNIGTSHWSHRRRTGPSNHERELINADLVEIDSSGAIVPLGTSGRGGVRPPPHTFYGGVILTDPLGQY